MNNPNKTAIAMIVAFGLVIVIATLAVLASGGKSERDRKSAAYAAIGDSYSAGMGIEPVTDKYVPSECLQSTKSYPQLVQTELDYASFVNVTCAGATLDDLPNSQALDHAQSNPPQIESVGSGTELVTFSLGGNDAGFWGMATTCFLYGQPDATPCLDNYVPEGEDRQRARIDRIAPYFRRALDEVKKRAPKARIIVVGYPHLTPSDGKGCESTLNASTEDAAYVDSVVRYLNEMMQDGANVVGADFVDIYKKSAGHDACKPAGTRWVEPIENYDATVPLHPNAAGEKAMAELIVNKVRGQ